MTLREPAVPAPSGRNRAERRAADRQRRRRKGLAAATGASVIVSGAGFFSPASALVELQTCTIEVTDTSDAIVVDEDDETVPTPGSLRAAVLEANANVDESTICFSEELTPESGPIVIALSQGDIAITTPVNLQGPGMDALEITGATTTEWDVPTTNGSERLFALGAGDHEVVISGLTMRDSRPVEYICEVVGEEGCDDGYGVRPTGGALRAVDVNLTIDSVRFEGNEGQEGGALQFLSGDAAADLRIVDSVLTGNWADGGGGAVYAFTTGSVRFEGTTFSENDASNGGAANIGLGGTGTLTTDAASVFQTNTAGDYGGGMFVGAEDSAVVTINGTEFEHNGGGAALHIGAWDGASVSVVGATSVDASWAGLRLDVGDDAVASVSGGTDLSDNQVGLLARSNGAATLTVADSTISGNEVSGIWLEAKYESSASISADVSGGGGDATGITGDVSETASVTVAGSTISGTATGIGLEIQDAGFVSISAEVSGNDRGIDGELWESGRLEVVDSTIVDNIGASSGAGVHLEIEETASALVAGTTIDGNVSTGDGGGLHVVGTGAFAIENSTIAGNEASGRGGAGFFEADATVRLSTVTGNSADEGGGGFFAYRRGTDSYQGDASLELESTIVSGNFGVDGVADDLATGDLLPADEKYPAIVADYSLIGWFDAADEHIDVDTDDGNVVGEDPLLELDDGSGTYDLGSGSPALNAGHPSGSELSELPSVDQRGQTRVREDRVDMGSVEFQPAAPFIPTPTTTTPPTTTPPTTTPPQQPAPPAPSRGGSTGPVFVDGTGTGVRVPLPPSAPPGQVSSSVAVSPTESIAVSGTGEVFFTNPAHNFGQIPPTTRLRSPIVGMGMHWTLQETSDADFAAAAQEWVPSGYWLLGADGGVFSFGTAKFLGSTGALKLNQPVVAITPTPTGDGYWLVASDGGVFSFGDATFFGSTGDLKLAQPVVAMLPTASGKGYWLIGADGGVFTFGDAPFLGSASKTGLAFTGAVRAATGPGYVLLAADGTRHPFGG